MHLQLANSLLGTVLSHAIQLEPPFPPVTALEHWTSCPLVSVQVEKAGMTIGIRALADKSYDMDELEVGHQSAALRMSSSTQGSTAICPEYLLSSA